MDLGASSIVLLDAGGQMVLSTKRPYGTVLPVLRSAPLLTHTLATGLPGISKLFVNPVDRQYIYTLSVPLRQNGEVVYSLNATYSPDALDGILREQRMPDGWRAAIVDYEGKIVARSHEAARFTGHTVLPKLFNQLSANNEGAYDDVTLDGIPVMTAFSKSPLSHWSIVIGIPQEESAAPKRIFIGLAVALFIVAGLIGIAIIWWLSAYLNRLADAGEQASTQAPSTEAGLE